MATDYETILVDVDGGVTTVTLNRPDQRNAINLAMEQELHDAMWSARGRRGGARDRRHRRGEGVLLAGST